MTKKFLILIYKFFFNNLFIFFNKDKTAEISYGYNFQNIVFEDLSNLKAIFFSEKYFLNRYLDDRSHAYHTFNFIKVGKIQGGSKNVSLIKKHIFNWDVKKYKKTTFVWSSKYIAERFVNLIYTYDFYASSSSDEDIKAIHGIILQHYLLLRFEIPKKIIFQLNILELKAFVLGQMIHKKDTKYVIKLIISLLSSQIDNNGFHKSYNPSEHINFLNNLHEIKNILLYFNVDLPAELNFHIINMTSLLISLNHADNTLALFNGSNNTFIYETNKLVNLVKDIKPKKINNIKNGIAIYSDKKSKLFMDIVKPSNNSLNKNIHAGTLSFEFSHEKDKIITNCGSLKTRIGNNPEYLRYSAAHSTIIINNTNITELIKKNSYKRIPENINFNISDDSDFILWEASHDGYLKNYFKIIKRKIYISKLNNGIKGQDIILNTKINTKPDVYNIRFHLMPECDCLLTNNKKTVLIKTKNNISWVFRSDSLLNLEDSIYINQNNKIEQNKQIVISGQINNKNVIKNWSLFKS